MQTSLAATPGPFRDAEPDGTRLLFVSRDPVMHAFHGANAAVHALLKLLREGGFAVTVLVTAGASRSPRLAFRNAFKVPAGVRVSVPGYWRIGPWWLQPFSVRAWGRAALRLAERRGRGSRGLAALFRWLGLDLSDRPWDLTEPTAAERALVVQALAQTAACAVVANYAYWGPLLAEVRQHAGEAAPRTLIVMHDLLAEHARLFQERGLPLDCIPISEAMESAWLNGAETVLAIQADEAAAIRPRISARVLVQPIHLPAEAASASPDALRCLFVGSNSPPNVQGLQWMMHSVWPRVRAAVPGAVLAVAGSVCSRVGEPPAGVNLMGHVPSLADEHRRATVCVVPLLVGSGLKIKLLEALSYSKATVSTRVGVQGLAAWVEGAVAVADEPELFAAEVVRLLLDPQLRQQRERGAAALVAQHFAAGSSAERELFAALRGPCDSPSAPAAVHP